MHASDWRLKSDEHVSAARHLLANRQSSCGFYLTGLAVECALKACIARQFRPAVWPNLDFVQRIHTHDLDKLGRLAGLEAERRAKEVSSSAFRANWAFVRDWSVGSRYSVWSFEEATDMVHAAAASTDGVLPWVRLHW